MNNTIFYFFYNFAYHSAFFDELVIFFSVYFIYIVIIASLIFLFRSSRKELILLCISGGLAYAFAKILKILMHTERPFVLFPQVTSLFLETGYAFPSGHTAVASAIAFLIYFYNKKAVFLFICIFCEKNIVYVYVYVAKNRFSGNNTYFGRGNSFFRFQDRAQIKQEF